MLEVKEVSSSLLGSGKFKIRQVASVLGFLNDLCKAADFGFRHLKWLDIDKIRALKESGAAGFEGFMTISSHVIEDLNW